MALTDDSQLSQAIIRETDRPHVRRTRRILANGMDLHTFDTVASILSLWGEADVARREELRPHICRLLTKDAY